MRNINILLSQIDSNIQSYTAWQQIRLRDYTWFSQLATKLWKIPRKPFDVNDN